MIAEAVLLDALEAVHSGRLRVHEAYRTIRAAETKEPTDSQVAAFALAWGEADERRRAGRPTEPGDRTRAGLRAVFALPVAS